MNEDELTDAVLSARNVLKVETLDAYDDAGDDGQLDAYVRGDPKPDPATKADWLDLLRARADAGHPWRWLRIVTRPVSQYVRYACEFGYVDNVEVGHVDLRVLDEATWPADVFALRSLGDHYLLDGRLVAMRFQQGRFVSADGDVRLNAGAHLDLAWSRAVPFAEWWTGNPELHRIPAPV